MVGDDGESSWVCRVWLLGAGGGDLRWPLEGGFGMTMALISFLWN